MDLGELAFKVEDIQRAIKTVGSEWEYDPDLENPGEVKKVLDMLNQILAEKLQSAPLMYGKSADADLWGSFDGRPRDSHMARLVCIEEISGKLP